MVLEVLQADVTKLEVDAIANAANTRLLHGGGVAAAISRAGGPAVQEESHKRAPRSTLAKAEELGARSLALLAFGTGVGGFSLDGAAEIMVRAAREHEPGTLERVVFAAHGDEAERAFRDALA